MDGSEFEETALFRNIAQSGVQAVLFGRRALIALGLPVATFDYDFWINIDEAERFNRALEPLGLIPNRSPEEARLRGRYVLENDMRVDVLVARSHATMASVQLSFAEVWSRRQMIEVAPDVSIAVPSIDDLISTKTFGARTKDAEDIALLRALKEKLK